MQPLPQKESVFMKSRDASLSGSVLTQLRDTDPNSQKSMKFFA